MSVKMKLWAAQELLKRYRYEPKVNVDEDILQECMVVIADPTAKWYQKKSSRMILEYVHGKQKTNEMIEDIAVVAERNDPLVRQWTRAILKRDKDCQKCGSTKDLQAHHISAWADDPIGRIQLSNGIALCKSCHASEHPDLANLILSRGVQT